ncbi:MAG: hypothetical protein HY220_01375 [Candidatus Sungbacteria bacterium]|uniref:Uncharacterized protein n=1 Tax=Candidatus Sungiibacteriota bacterium TaxID=2750080 RepID=A0A9D6LPJ1_9BACT|nr:hypothetical protein [Candidatus Sungbacteria bacterium]
MIFTISLILFSIFILGYLLFGLAILYHLRAYILPNWYLARTVSGLFIGISIVFLLLAAFYFFQIPWASYP